MSVFSLPSNRVNHLRERAFRRSFLISMVLHAIVLAAAGGMTLFRASGMVYSPSYTVDLVSLAPSPGVPGKGEGKGTGTPGAELRPAPKPEPKPQPKPEPKPETKPAPKPAPAPAAPVKKTPLPAAVQEKKPPPPAPPQPSSEVKTAGGDEAAAQRLERQKRIQELEEEARHLYESFTGESGNAAAPPAGETPAPSGEKTGKEGAGQGGTGAGGAGGITGSGLPGGGGQPADIRFRAYYDLVWSRIRSSWILPEGVATRDRLLTVVGIRIAPDGNIEEYRLEKGSGNAYYDQSALRAIRKASPLPPLPEDLAGGPLEIGVNFRYPE